MDKKRELVENLKKLVREKRASIDPAVLKRAERAALKSQGLPDSSGSVPYDRKAAASAIEKFLHNHPDREGFRAKLLDFMTKKSH